MSPKRAAADPPPPPSPPCRVDFRASEDDAWYGVRMRVEEEGEEEHWLRVMYCNFPEVCDERFREGAFGGERELAEFRGRFRTTSAQLQDWECGQLIEGMTVCASHVFGESDVRFYDAIVDAVCFSEHKIVEGDEVCKCTFVLLWLHGPNAGRRTSAGVEQICLLQPGDAQIDSALDHFLELSKKKLESSRQGSCKVSAGSSVTHEPIIVEDDLDGSDNDLLGMRSPHHFDDTKHRFEGGSCSYRQNLGQDIDLGGDFDSKEHIHPKDCYHFIWIENLEKDVSPQDIVDFIYQQTSILSQAHISPSLLSESYTRGIIFLETKTRAEKLLHFLHNPAHIIMSSRGRPWVIIERKWSYGSTGGLILKSEKKPYNSNKIKMVYEGTKEYVKARRLCELFIEFHEHLQRLHQRLGLEEKKLMQSSPSNLRIADNRELIECE